MEDFHAHVANGAATLSIAGWVTSHVAGFEMWIQLVLGLVTICAMAWSIAASQAKKRHYERLRRRDEGQDSGV